jgi:hypothetical protein
MNPLAIGAGALVGGVGSLIANSQAEKAAEEAKQRIANRPKYEDSAAYANAAAQAGRADRYAQQGFSSQERADFDNSQSRIAGGAISNANSLASGLQGLGGVSQSLTDSYRSMLSDDAALQRANRGQAFAQNQNLQQHQAAAYQGELGRYMDETDLGLAEQERNLQATQGMMDSIAGGAQGLLDTGAMQNFNLGGLFNGNGNKNNNFATPSSNFTHNGGIPQTGFGSGNIGQGGFGKGSTGGFGR